MSFFKKNPLLSLGLLALFLVGLPVAVFLSQKTQEQRTRASASTSIYFMPNTASNPLQKNVHDTVSFDVMISPGNNLASSARLEILWDPAILQPVGNGFVANTQVPIPNDPSTNSFAIQQGPVVTSGKLLVALTVGSDPSKAIRQVTKVGTINFTAIAPTASSPTTISLGGSSQVLSVASTDTATENVLSTKSPASVIIGSAGTITPTITTSPTTTPPLTCASSPSSTMLIIDRSGSMTSPIGSSGTKLSNAKTAAKSFVDIISQDTRNALGLVSFSDTATLDNPLSNNFSAVKTKIDSLTAVGSTCTECAILKANQEIARDTSGKKKVVVLLTDGIANAIEGGPASASTADVAASTTAPIAEQRALAAALAGHNASGTVFYTIGLGSDVNSSFLRQIATTTGGQYFASPTTDQLNTIYNQISQISGRGAVSGVVFNDANGNAVFDSTESKLSGWTLQLLAAGSTTPQTIVSDNNGFSITGLCNGTYTLKEVLQSGYRQTLPTDPNGYQINIINGGSLTDKNFGNKLASRCNDGIDNDTNGFIDARDSSCHTDGNPGNPNSYDPTKDGEHGGNTCDDGLDNNGNNLIDGADPVCHTGGNINNPYDPNLPEGGGSGTGLLLNVFLHGIGASGDNANPTGNSLSNKNPLHPTRPAKATIYDVSNHLIATASGEINYSSASGNYTGRVQTSNTIAAGTYNIRTGTTQHLIRLEPGIQTISATQDNQLPAVSLVTGDVNNDNQIDILDYNLLIGCYSDLLPAPSCADQTQKSATDINDDGPVNQTDYNLFIREISTQPGQ